MTPSRQCHIRLLACAFLLLGAAHGDDRPFVEIRAADSARALTGRPVEVVSMEGAGVVRIERADGSRLNLPLDRAAPEDRARLRQWMEAWHADPHAKLVRRMTAAKSPALLFIGNSYSFGVPDVFRKMVRDEGRAITVEQVTKGGWPLGKHADAPETLAAIRSRKWDVIVLQEQSLVPAFPAGQRDSTMMPALERLAGEIHKAGALPALYQTWGRRDGDQENAGVFPDDTFEAMHARLAAGFAMARSLVPSLTAVPVGDAWAARMKDGTGRSLYVEKDGSHPSPQGVYLAAAVFYSTLFDAGVTKAPDTVDDAKALNALAAKLGRLRLPPYPVE